MGYIYIFFTVIFTVIGQILLKWRMDRYDNLPIMLYDKIIFIFRILMDPFVIISLGSAFVASIFWMAAMTKFDISFAYPFMSMSYILVLILSFFLFNEPVTLYKIVGLLLIATGVWVSSKSI